MSDEEIERLLELHHVDRQKVRLILLPTVVEGKRGKPVRGLKAGDFRLYEDYVPQKIRLFVAEASQPISIAFLLDLSGSMRQVGRLAEAKQAIRGYIAALRPEDRIALIGFADQRVDWITEFTTDRGRFLKRLEVQRAYGETALFDAVARAPAMVDQQVGGRAAIVLITDGIDNASTMNSFDAIRLARSVNVPIYSVGFSSLSPKMMPKGAKMTVLRMLELFSEETGGLLLPVYEAEDLEKAVARIGRDLRFQYVLGYYSRRSAWDGSYRRIKLELTQGNRTVRTRRGYYAKP